MNKQFIYSKQCVVWERREGNSRALMESKGNWGRKKGNAMKAIKVCVYKKRKENAQVADLA